MSNMRYFGTLLVKNVVLNMIFILPYILFYLQLPFVLTVFYFLKIWIFLQIANLLVCVFFQISYEMWSYQYTTQNVAKSSNASQIKHIKTRKVWHTKKTADETEYILQIMTKMKMTCTKYENHGEYHIFLQWYAIIQSHIAHAIYQFYWKFCWISVCGIFCVCKMWQFIQHHVYRDDRFGHSCVS